MIVPDSVFRNGEYDDVVVYGDRFHHYGAKGDPRAIQRQREGLTGQKA